jgi:hypothetical protein
MLIRPFIEVIGEFAVDKVDNLGSLSFRVPSVVHPLLYVDRFEDAHSDFASMARRHHRISAVSFILWSMQRR